jgi:hypothetical protein
LVNKRIWPSVSDLGKQPGAEDQRDRGDDQRYAERGGDESAGCLAVVAEISEPDQRQRGGGRAARREPARDAPVDRAVQSMHRRAADFGEAGIEQIGADGGRRMDAEQQHQHRRHQRAAANAGEADQRADRQSREGVERIKTMQKFHDEIRS